MMHPASENQTPLVQNPEPLFIMNKEESICWYHGKISREAAEQILKTDGGNEDGAFLVRESNTAVGDYVLSVVYEGEVIHYQIRRHGEDAFFSIDEQTIIHGLETLIEYYQEAAHGLVTKLTQECNKDPPPHDSRRHGRTNLLHRATKEGNYTVVSELLKCGYRSLEAKNQDGQTAVHLASRLGKDEILKKLIESGANINCRDTAGYTPLHYACQSNLPSTVRILIQIGFANVQARNTETGWVPLHEAASCGHKEVVRVLLSLNAPVNPRTIANDTPADLARRNGYLDCYKIFKNYKSPSPKMHKKDWYHGTLDRSEALAMLKEYGNKDGTFLVRYSDRNGGMFVLTTVYADQPYHFQIRTQGKYYFIDDGPYLDSLEHVIEHYSLMSDGLPTTLQIPVPPTPKPPVPDMHPSFNGHPAAMVPQRQPIIRCHGTTTSNTSPLCGHHGSFGNPIPMVLSENANKPLGTPALTASPIPSPAIQDSPRQSEFIPRDCLIMGSVLGEGEFGSVYKGTYEDQDGRTVMVAIKTLHQEHMAANRDEFLREAKVMMGLNHHCIVRLIGISKGPPLLMVQELIPLGSMLAYLLEFPDRVNPNYELKVWASQIACGMKYLEEQRFVHRDLAARNILLSSRHQAKISDFGLSRALGAGHEYYTATQGGRWPIKWYAPESYNFGTFSHASDVWSFGVTLWEMFSYGKQPWGELRGAEVTKLVDKGERLAQPEHCPDSVYRIMEQCWAYKPRDRPTFSELLEIFSSDPEYINIKELIFATDIS